MRILRSIAVLSLGAVVGCVQILIGDEESYSPADGTSLGSVPCTTAADCPEHENSCAIRACRDNLCGLDYAQIGFGCDKFNVCDGHGGCKSPNGAACSSVDECASGNCVDGVCCDTACTGICEACAAPLKAEGSDGVCDTVIVDTDPADECVHGACVARACSCDAGFAGLQCDACAEGYLNYPECVANCPPEQCNFHGSCMNNVCSCTEGFAGETCNTCAPGYIDYPYCVKNCPQNQCNGHGSCSSNVCTCNSCFAEPNCGSCASGCIGYPNCVPNCPPGYCNGHGSCSTNVCSCYTGYAGVNCTTCAAGYGGYPNCVLKGCWFFSDSGFAGSEAWIAAGSSNADLYSIGMEDKISSSDCRGGASATLWYDDNFLGGAWTVSGAISTYVGNPALANDKASSIKVY